MEPRIVGESEEEMVGRNNANLEKAIERVDKSNMYKDLSTIIICPTRGVFPTRVVQSWMKLMKPLNHQIAGPIFAEAMNVDDAYNELMRYILANKYLKTFKYILTIEEDNIPPSDGLIKLYEGMEEYDIIGGLYWGKGDTGFPMIFGNPDKSGDSSPQKPVLETLQKCNGLGMGFTLIKLDIFNNIEGPYFKTVQEVTPEGGEHIFTQDMYFYNKARKAGYKIACNTKVRVGHYELDTDTIW